MTVKQLKYRCSVDSETLTVENINKPYRYLRISFQRTIRVPANFKASFLPPGLGRFPLYKVQDYASRLPPELASKGGVFLPIHRVLSILIPTGVATNSNAEKEAMWIRLSLTTPFMINIYCGGVNAVSAEHHSEDLSTKFRRLKLKMEKESIQDYIVTPKQIWVDGIVTEPGIVRQFVAMPMGQGYTVEAQLTGKEINGGLQFEIAPSLINEIGSTPRAENDFTPPSTPSRATTPPCPIDASTYAEADLPFFDLYEEPSSIAGDFEALKSVNEIEQDRGLAEESEPPVKPRLVKLDRQGRAIPTGSQVDPSVIVDDPDGILNPAGPMRELRTLADLEREIKSLTLDSENKLWS
ncbi:hypothetical protein DL767_003701 [Monosporascus sp. MG133]|nr:hypothetical protein DL767_003701 [Monosporascus sp. MG133]